MAPEKNNPEATPSRVPAGTVRQSRWKAEGSAHNRATLAAEALLDCEAEALTRKAIELALAGDPMERLMPPRKDRAITFPLPDVISAADAAQAIGAVIAALAEGRITPSEAVTVAGLLEGCRRAIESVPPTAALAPPPV